MPIVIKQPKGRVPIITPAELGDSYAQVAQNCELWSGGVRPLRNHSQEVVLTPANVQTIYRFGRNHDNLAAGFWFRWPEQVEVAKGPIPNDVNERTYYTGDGVPKMTYASIATSAEPYPSAAYTLGIPQPDAPTAVAVGTASGDEALREARAYVVTYVSELGEEGPPSDPSPVVTDLDPGQEVALGIDGAPTGAYNVTHKRIYRSNTTAVGTQYQLLVQVAVSAASYSDTTASSDLAEVLPTVGWSPPPDDMRGICFTANGIGAGFSANALCLSVPYQPHAWPVELRKYTDYNIVAIAPTGNAIIIGTIEEPYICYGSDPVSMTLRKLDIQQGCASRRSMQTGGDLGVVFASNDGLVYVTQTGQPKMLTEGLFSRKEWRSYNPSSMVGAIYDDRYYCFYSIDAMNRGGFYIDPLNPELGVVFLASDPNYPEGGVYHDPLSGDMYIVRNNAIFKFEGETTLQTVTWRSKRFFMGRPDPMGYARITAEDYSDLKFRLHYRANPTDVALTNLFAGQTPDHVVVANAKPFKLPTNYYSREVEIEIFGTSSWSAFAAAESISELSALPT